LRFGGALWRFWYVRGYLSEGLAWLRRFLAKQGAADSSRAKALNGAGILAGARGDYAAARRYHEESLSIRSNLKDRQGVAHSLSNLGMLERGLSHYDAARTHYEDALAIYQ